MSSPLSGSKWNLGTRNRLRPLVPGPPAPSTPTGRASTRWRMFSARSCSPAVMKRLTPSMFQVPSLLGVALVRPAPTSEPASGSVSIMVAPQRFSAAISAIRLSRSVPCSQTTRVAVGKPTYVHNVGLAPRTNSPSAQFSELGAAVPPSSGSTRRRHHSASSHVLYVAAYAGGTVTVWLAGSNTVGVRSESSNDAARSSLASRSTSRSAIRAVSASTSSNGPTPSTRSRSRSSNRTNSTSRRLLL